MIPSFNMDFTSAVNFENEMLEQQMILREFDCLTKLDHPLIQEILEVFVDKHFIYFVSPFYSGGELYDLMFNDDSSVDSYDLKQLKPEPISEE